MQRAFSCFDAALPRYRPLLFDQQLSVRLLGPGQQRGSLNDTPEWGASWQKLGVGRRRHRSAALRFQKEWDNWKIGRRGYAYEKR